MSAPPVVPGLTSRWVDVPGRVRLHVAEGDGGGEGAPVLLVHGWPGHFWCWRDVVPHLLQAGRRVLAVDLRGFGWSDAPPRGYRKDELADDLAGLLDVLGVERVDLLSHDWGGMVGHHLCVRRPDLVRAHVAVNTGHLWPQPAALRSLWPLYTYQLAFEAPVVWRWGPRWGCRMIGRWARWPREVTEVYAQRLVPRDRARATRDLYRSFFFGEVVGLARGAMRDVVLQVPTLQLHGAGDPVVRADAFEPFVGDATHWRFERLRGMGHFPPEEDGERIATRALAFFTTPAPAPDLPRETLEALPGA
jgi:pimeloyl-ACP methyl ester carboxylesterase